MTTHKYNNALCVCVHIIISAWSQPQRQRNSLPLLGCPTEINK